MSKDREYVINDPDTGIECLSTKKGWYPVADFAFHLLYRIVDEHDNVVWQGVIKRTGEDDYFLEFQNDELATPAKFHTVLLKHGYVFRGGNYELNLLKEVIVGEAKHAEHILSLGHHKASGLYFFSNGALNQKEGTFHRPDDNFILDTEGGSFYLPYEKHEHLKQYQSLCRYKYIENTDVTFDAWVGAFADAYGKESLAPLCHRVASYFRDLAFEKVRFFPIQYCRGPAGTGKSTMARSLTAIDGTPQAEISLKSANTTKSLPRRLDQVRNSLIWFDEYHNGMPPDVQGTLQGVYDGSGYAKALKDNSNLTTSVNVQSAIILTSNYTPDCPVFLTRCVVNTFNLSKRTHEQVEAFRKLNEMEGGNLSPVAVEILTHRELIKKHWLSTYKKLKRYFQKTTEDLPARAIDNTAVILTPVYILETEKKIHLKAAFGLDMELLEWGRLLCIQQAGIQTGRSDLHLFFEVVSSGVDSGRIRPDFEYTMFQPKKEDMGVCMGLNLSKIMPYYLKEYRTMYNKIGLKRDEILNLLEACPAYVGNYTVKMKPPSGGKKIPYKNTPVFRQEQLSDLYGVNWNHAIFSRKK